MTKKKLSTSINYLRKLFSHDEESLEALDFLERKSTELEFEETSTSSNEFTLPSEVKGKVDAFAVFSDGACRGNPGPGSWGAIGQNSEGEVIFESSGVEVSTTNNRMELEGAIQAIEELRNNVDAPSTVNLFLYSDSKYVVDGINQWIAGWKKRGWKKADKKPPENLSHWQRLDESKNGWGSFKALWVKGHSGHPQNERCDQLANFALDESGF